MGDVWSTTVGDWWCVWCGQLITEHATGCRGSVRIKDPPTVEVTAVDVDKHGRVSITLGPVKGAK